MPINNEDEEDEEETYFRSPAHQGKTEGVIKDPFQNYRVISVPK